MPVQGFQDYTIVVGTCEGHPIKRTVTAQEQKEMHEVGYTDHEIYQFFSTYEDWQKDC